MNLKDRFRRFTGHQRPGVELVRLDQPEDPAPPPRRLRALPAPTYPVCEACGHRHPRPLRRPRGLAAYQQVIAADPWTTGRPRPLGQSPDADVISLTRDRFHPWR